jgi:predicted enzyme related to lactoylglutathione lyase
MRNERHGVRLIAWAVLAGLPLSLSAQPNDSRSEGAAAVPVRGIYNWVHTTGDAEAAFAFYHDVFDIELAPFPFSDEPTPAPEGIRPAADARSDTLVWNLTNTHGSRFRTVFMRAPNTPFGLELSEFFDIPRSERPTDPWEPGASMLIFAVRDLDAVMATLAARAAAIVTTGGAPIDTSAGRAIVVRDPDGYLLRIEQAAQPAIAAAADAGQVIATSIGISVAATPAALAYYRDLLGFRIGETRSARSAELRVHGLAAGSLDVTTTTIPGTDVTVELLTYDVPSVLPARIAWRIEDVGAPQFQLQVAGLDALIDRTLASGYRFLSVDAEPIDRPFGRFVFAIDPDGVLVEYVEPARPRQAGRGW